MNALDALAGVTYELRHNPNCPSPYLLVTSGNGGRVYPDLDERNFHAYGKTLDQAVALALFMEDARRAELLWKAEWCAMVARVEAAMWPVRGVVWC